jgi:MFS family permease
LLPLYLGMALLSIGDFGMSSWIPALLSRRFGMNAGEIGEAFGTAVIIGAAIGAFGGGFIADRSVASRGAQARFAVALLAAGLALPGAFAGLGGSAHAVIAGYAWWSLMSTAAGAVGITALQDIVPNHMRGIAIALVSFGNMMFGLGGGAALIAWVNDHAFADPRAIGTSMTLVTLPAIVIALMLFWRVWHVARATALKER